jgi:hypothetical protein
MAIGPARVGVWTMRIRATALNRAQERCTTSVYVESDLVMRVSVSALDVNQPVTVAATVLHEGKPASGVKLALTVTRPTRSLAQVQTQAVIAHALNADHVPIPAGRKRLIPTKQTKHQLKFDGKRGYRATLPPVRVDGVYEFAVEAIGPACGGTFERYSSQSLYIGRKGDPGRTSVSISPTGATVGVVRIKPRDSKGKALGPLAVSGSTLGARDAVVQAVIDNGDGSLSAYVSWERRQKSLTLELNGDPIVVELPVKRRAAQKRSKS